MQMKYSFMNRAISILLVSCLLLMSVIIVTKLNFDNTSDLTEQENEASKALRKEIGMEVLQNEDSTISYAVDGKYGKFELKYDEDTGEIFYIDDDGEYLLEITDVSADGIASWKVEKENETLEGEVNTAEAVTPQFAIAIAGSTVVISSALYYSLIWAGKVCISGVVCYAASKLATTLKRKANNAEYFPAYLIGNDVYIAAGIGLSYDSAVIRIRWGKSVWATSKHRAKVVCKSASPIGYAEWGWHGSVDDGYFPHYHAVKRYYSDGTYSHTGAHCWYY